MPPASDTGSPIATQKENLSPKNSQSTRKTSASPWMPFTTTSLRRSRTTEAPSETISRLTSCGNQHKIGQFLGCAALLGNADQEGFVAAFDAAGGKIDRGGLHCPRHVRDGKPEALQGFHMQRNAQFRSGESPDLDLRDGAAPQHACAQIIGQLLQFGPGLGAGEGNRGNEFRQSERADPGRLRAVGKIVYGVDLGADVGAETLKVRRPCQKAREQQQDHQQIGRRRVIDEIADHFLRSGMATADSAARRFSRASSRTGARSWPGIRGDRSLTIRRIPASSPSPISAT